MHLSRNLMTMMKSSLVGMFLFLLLSCAVSGLGSVVSRNYSYIEKHYTWQEAQSYCRNSGGQNDLATLYTQSDSDALDLKSYHAWIGLYRQRDPIILSNGWIYDNGWNWNNGADLNQWISYNLENSERCGYTYYTNGYKMIGGADCESYYFFICDHSNFKPVSKTWSEARYFCQSPDLAQYTDKNDLNKNVDLENFPVWIGLHREGETWNWSAGVSDYIKWASDQSKANGDCVTISSNDKHMTTHNCADRFPFICSGDNLILVQENKTWEEAVEYCRALSYELVSVQPEDYEYLRSRVMEANTEEVWTGLRFLAGEWLWVNGADMMYSDLPLCPPMEQRCGTFSKNGSMETRDCAERRNFLCYCM